MNLYLILLRGINVGGKNKVPMAELRRCVEDLGFSRVSTFIASGNVILESEKTAREVETKIESALVRCFKLDSDLIRVLVLTPGRLQAIIDKRPDGFGESPQIYHSDVIFLIRLDSAEAIKVFNPREGIDKVWAGDGVIYSQRLSSMRTKSRLSVIVSSPLYQSMTIRNWNTTVQLLKILNGLSEVKENS